MQQLVGRAKRAQVSILMAAALLAACGGATEVVRDVPGPLAHITVTPPNASVGAGQAQKFTAVGTDAGGGVVSITAQWSVIAGGGTIDQTGLFTADTKAGVFANTISAKSGSITGLASLTVTPGGVATLAITPTTVSLASGATQQFAVAGKDAYGNDVTVTPTWSVIAGGGTITATGLFTATTAGTFANTVRATVGTLSATATVTVTPGVPTTIQLAPATVTMHPGEQQQFTVTARDAAGNDVTPTVAWSVVAGGGSIDGTGRFTAGSAIGTFTNTVKATVGTLTALATVTVNPGTVTTIVFVGLGGGSVSLKPGDKYQFTVQGRDAGGNVVTFTPVWSITPNGGGTIDGTGLFTAGTKAGTYTLTATLSTAMLQRVSGNRAGAPSGAASGASAPAGLVTASTSVTVVPGELKLIDITPKTVTLAAGATQQFLVAGRDQWLNEIVIFPKWTLDNGGGTIGELGLFTAGPVSGTYTVRATTGTLSAAASVTVVGGGALALGRAASFALIAYDGVRISGASTRIVGDAAVLGMDPWGIGGLTPHLYGTAYVGNGNAVAESAFVAASALATALEARPCDHSLLNIEGWMSGRTFGAGKWCYDGQLGGNDNFVLDAGGDPKAVFIFEASGFNFWSEFSNVHVVLRNGAQADNVFWMVNDAYLWNFTLVGNVLVNSETDIWESTIIGRLFAPVPIGVDRAVVALPGRDIPPAPEEMRAPTPNGGLEANATRGSAIPRLQPNQSHHGWPVLRFTRKAARE